MKKYWPYFAFVVVALLFFFRFLDGMEAFAFKDLSRYFYPLRYLMVEQVKLGHLPMWNPFIFCGMPLFATLQIGFLYPLTIIYYLLPFTLAFNYYIIIHFLLASIFMYLLMRHYKFEKAVAFISGIIFAYSGYLMSVSNMNTSLSSVIWLPLVILFWDKAINSGRFGIKDLGSGILALALMFLGGEPTIIYVTAWLMLFYGLVFGLDWKRTILSLIIVFIFVTGLTAVQLIPFAELVNNSDRVVLTQFHLISMRSLPPRELVNFVMPLFFGNQLRAGSYVPNFLGKENQDWLLSTYVGFIPLFFASIGIFLFSRKTNFWLVVFLGSIILAFGSYTPLYHLIYKFFPGISMIRFPVKYLFMAFFSLSILVGFGFSKVLNVIDSEDLSWLKRSAFILGSIFIILGIICYLLNLYELQIFKHYAGVSKDMPPYLISQVMANVRFNLDSFSNLMLLVFIAAFSVYAVFKGWLGRQMFCVFVLGVILLDLLVVNSAINLPSDVAVYEKITPNIKILQAQKGVFRYFYSASFESFNRSVYGDDFDKSLIEAKDRLVADRIIPYNLQDFYGYESILTNDFRKFTTNYWGDMLSKKRSMTDILNCRFIISGERLKSSGLKLLRSTKYFYGESFLYENLNALPRAFFAHKAKYVGTRKEIQALMQDQNFNAKDQIYLEGATKEVNYIPSAGKVLSIQYDFDKINLGVSNKNSGLLFVSDVYYPGWHAKVDGRNVQIMRADLIFRAIEVPSGEHEIVFYFDPMSFKIGLGISVFTIFSMLFIFMRRKT